MHHFSLAAGFALTSPIVYFLWMNEKVLLIITTAPNDEISEKLAKTLVGQGLAACVNILPGMRSIYKWNGKLEIGQEQLLMIKAPQSAYSAIEQQIEALHPYELPEIIAVSIEAGLPAYLDWVRDRVPNESQ